MRERFEETQKHLISGIDLVVVVAKNHYVPYGIDTDRFCPEERQSRRECVRLISHSLPPAIDRRAAIHCSMILSRAFQSRM